MSIIVTARVRFLVKRDCVACAQAYVRDSVGAPVDEDIEVETIEHIEDDFGYEEGESPDCPHTGEEEE